MTATQVRPGRPVQFGLLYFSSGEETQHRDKYRLVIEGARFADRHGFAAVWVPERHFTQVGCLFPNPSVVQAALARETSRVRLRAGSVVLPLHHPVRVAEEWSVVDNLSDGRVELSFASGWHPDDFLFAPERYADRHEEMYRGIEVVQKLWRGEPYRGKGGDGKEAEIRVYPTPVQKELTYWLTAAGNPKTFARAGTLGAHLLTHLFNQGLEETAKKIAIYRKARAEAGHDPATGRVAVMLHTFVGADLDGVRQRVRGPFLAYLRSSADLLKAIAFSQGQDLDFAKMSEQDREFLLNFVFERLMGERVLFGTPESCLAQVERLREVGVDEIACQVDFGVPTDTILESLPHLNRLRELCAAAADGLPGQAGRLSHQEAPSLPVGQASRLSPAPESPEVVRGRCGEEVSGAAFYAELERRGLRPAGPRAVEHLWRGRGEALARVRLPEDVSPGNGGAGLHPAYLDTCRQVLLAALPPGVGDGGPLVPGGLRGFRLLGRPGAEAWCHAVARGDGGGSAPEGDVRLLDEAGRPAVEVRGLRLRPAARAVDTGWARHADWLYEVRWEAKPGTAPGANASGSPSAPGSPGRWVIFADRRGVGEELAKRLRIRGEECVLATAAEPPGGGDLVCSSDGGTEAVGAFLGRVLGSGPVRGVVHLWSLDASAPAETTPASLGAAQKLGSDSVAGVIRALAGARDKPRLWMVTGGCQPAGLTDRRPAGPTPLGVAQSPLWGLGRMLEVEHPALWGGLVDLDPHAAAGDNARNLLAALDGGDREDQVAFRGGRRYVARLRRLRQPPRPARPLVVQAEGSYLITGGLGGIGLKLADWLVKHGARRVVLQGRTPLPPREVWDGLDARHPQAAAVDAIRDLEARGARVFLATADVADEARMAALVAELRAGGWLPLRGVFHAAGLGLDRPLAELDSKTLSTVLRPKVEGTWVLHRLLADEPLDFFVLFSSVNSILATQGQGSYAAANAFLDAVAHHRQAEGRPALCINWGPWGEVGFGATPQGVRQHALLALQGISRLTPQQGLEVLEAMLRQGPVQAGVIPIDWGKLLAAHSDAAAWPILSPLVEEERGKRGTAPARPKVSRGFVAPRNDLERALAAMWQEVLKAERVGVYDNFFELGGQSIQGAVLVNKLQERLGEVVHIVSLFDAPTIADLAVYLSDHYPAGVARLLAAEGAAGAAPAPAAAPAPEGPRPKLDSARVDQLQQVVTAVTSRAQPLAATGPKNPPAVFILSPPRCGSTLLRVMLAGHSKLFAPPELELLSFPTLAERKATFAGRNSYRLQGTVRALMEIYGWETERAARMMEAWEAEGWTTPRFYRLLQEGAAGKLLVDKTPSYALDPAILARAEAWFEEPLYIHLVRHPYGMILSFEEAHMEALFTGVDHLFTPRELAEAVWALSEQNIRSFLAGVSPRRQCRVRYEDLVSRPRETLEVICRTAGLDFEEGMTRPYQDKQRRMTDGIQMFGDVKFHKHTDIDPAMADRWAGRYTDDFLGDVTWYLAEAVGYARRREEAPRPAPRKELTPIQRRPRGGQVQVATASDAEVDQLLRLLSKDKKEP
jgi:natural product biosynthesis luciferase-like monooxygenase protein